MSIGYKVTNIVQSTTRQADGSFVPSYDVHYETTGDRPVSGVVTVPASLAADRTAYSHAVRSAIEAEVAGHAAVLGLGQPST